MRITPRITCATVTTDPVYVGMHFISFRLPVLLTRMTVEDDGCHIAQPMRRSAATITPTHSQLPTGGRGRSILRGDVISFRVGIPTSFKSGNVPFALDI